MKTTNNKINPLISKILKEKSRGTTRKRFSPCIIDNHQGLKTYECPECHQYFGLQVTFLEKMSEVNFHYFCSYCGHDGRVEN